MHCNLLKAQFNQNSLQISLKQKRLSLSHTETHCANPKIGSEATQSPQNQEPEAANKET
jgi:hypothetical protein